MPSAVRDQCLPRTPCARRRGDECFAGHILALLSQSSSSHFPIATEILTLGLHTGHPPAKRSVDSTVAALPLARDRFVTVDSRAVSH